MFLVVIVNRSNKINYLIFHISSFWTNYASWPYFAAVIIVICSSIIDVITDFTETFHELNNLTTTTTFWPQKAVIFARLPAYLLNGILIIFTLGWVLHTYYSFAKEARKIQQSFTGNNDAMEMGIDAIKTYSKNVLIRKKNWKEKRSLNKANCFASIYVVCSLCWSVAYAYEGITMQQTITIGTIINSVTHFLSYGSLTTIMWLTNQINLISFKLFIVHYDPYATLLTKKVYLPGILSTVLPGLASLVLPFIQNRFPW